MMRIAIIGGGPAGAASAILLARAGAAVTLFDDGKRPELVVGESLVPAVVPILRELGIEQDLAAISCVKPGATFIWSPSMKFEFNFARFAPAVPPYAYNVPRPQFDEALAQCALSAGVIRVKTRAALVTSNNSNVEVELAKETLALAPSLAGRQPDLIIDASGRARLIARVLSIPARVGPRDDIAHFAHFHGCRWDYPPGQIVVMRLGAGWSWCIPLKDRLSVGIVAGRDYWATLGGTPAERLEHGIAAHSALAQVVNGGPRISPVATYNNYQLVSARGVGPGWVAVGDAFGFVDPMLSPGVFLSLRSAEGVCQALGKMVREAHSPDAVQARLGRYASEQSASLDAWMELIAHFYDGRLAATVDAGDDWRRTGQSRLKSALQNHIERQVALLACGVGTTSRYGRGLLRFLGRHALGGRNPIDFAIR